MASESQRSAFEKMEAKGVPKTPELSSAAQPSKGQKSENEDKKLPKLSAQDFRIYNSMAEHMEMFHASFRQTWNTLYRAASTNTRPSGMSIRHFLSLITQFTHHLTIHHTIEEQHIFPVLAKKQPFFSPKDHALTQHRGIHEGVEKLEEWVQAIKEGSKDFDLRELRGIMDSFGEVLWKHLEDEVRELGAERMRLFWTREEMRRMPM